MPKLTPRHQEWLILLSLTILAFGVRIYRLDEVPPGWRDDDLINVLVISQKIIGGDIAAFYPDASGHEVLYHGLNGVTTALFGFGKAGMIGASIFFGTLSVPLMYLLARKLWGREAGLVAAVTLAVSFWALMYSRFALRHISLTTFTLAALTCFWYGFDDPQSWRGLLARQSDSSTPSKQARNYLLAAGLITGIGLYTYFASRGLPLILFLFTIYLLLWHRSHFQRHWRGLAMMWGLIILLGIPLYVTLQQEDIQPRVEEVGGPLTAARAGDFTLLKEHTLRTLRMFNSDGDDEWLYNIPYRPVFNSAGALLFWFGLTLVVWWGPVGALRMSAAAIRLRRQLGWRSPLRVLPSNKEQHLYVFLFLWWLLGISPAFMSVPAGSLGHTILAQPAVYLILLLGMSTLVMWSQMAANRWAPGQVATTLQSRPWILWLLLFLLFIPSNIYRDWVDYFQVWPQSGMVRFLYNADQRDVALYLQEHPELTEFGITGVLDGPWDQLALEITMDPTWENPQIHPRWYNPERALLLQPAVSFAGYPDIGNAYPDTQTPIAGGQAGGYQLSQTHYQLPANTPDCYPSSCQPPTGETTFCFANEFCLIAAPYDTQTGQLDLVWQLVASPLLPDKPLISNPPPIGVYNGPRLSVFVHLVDETGEMLTGDDGLWVDPYTLQAGDIFVQRHVVTHEEAAEIRIGMYDPFTGERLLTKDGGEFVQVTWP